MSDGKPRTASEIEQAIGSRCGGIIYNLYQKGVLWATDIKYFIMAMSYKGGGKWKRPHGKQRWYLLPEKEQKTPLSKEVSYLERDETGRKNVDKTELMVFKPYSREKRK